MVGTGGEGRDFRTWNPRSPLNKLLTGVNFEQTAYIGQKLLIHQKWKSGDNKIERDTVMFLPNSNSLLFWALCWSPNLISTCTWMSPHDLEVEQNKVMSPTGLTQQNFPAQSSPATKGRGTQGTENGWKTEGLKQLHPEAQPQIPPHTECGLSGKWVFVFHKDAEIWGCLLQYLAYPDINAEGSWKPAREWME